MVFACLACRFVHPTRLDRSGARPLPPEAALYKYSTVSHGLQAGHLAYNA